MCCCCRENEAGNVVSFSGCAVRLVDSAVSFNDGTLLANARMSRTVPTPPVSRPRLKRSGAVRARKEELWRLSWRCRGEGEKSETSRGEILEEVETNRVWMTTRKARGGFVVAFIVTKCQSARGFAT